MLCPVVAAASTLSCCMHSYTGEEACACGSILVRTELFDSEEINI